MKLRVDSLIHPSPGGMVSDALTQGNLNRHLLQVKAMHHLPTGQVNIRQGGRNPPPRSLASCLIWSFFFWRARNSSLQRLGATCSMRTWMRFGMILWPTCTALEVCKVSVVHGSIFECALVLTCLFCRCAFSIYHTINSLTSPRFPGQ